MQFHKFLEKRATNIFVSLWAKRMMPQVASTLQERLDKDLYRREGKGRRCRLGDRIASIPCHASCFAPE